MLSVCRFGIEWFIGLSCLIKILRPFDFLFAANSSCHCTVRFLAFNYCNKHLLVRLGKRSFFTENLIEDTKLRVDKYLRLVVENTLGKSDESVWKEQSHVQTRYVQVTALTADESERIDTNDAAISSDDNSSKNNIATCEIAKSSLLKETTV